ncbi:MAG: co-chaperone GroES [Paludibacteraceae bacterium]|nr:co-chaperone GroES [Paludibacteraceae bacterium]
MDLKVFGDKVIFRPLAENEDVKEQKSPGGIILPQTVREAQKQQRRNFKGTALYVGEACKFVKVGDIVSYDQFGVASFYHEGEELIICRENDLIGKYE